MGAVEGAPVGAAVMFSTGADDGGEVEQWSRNGNQNGLFRSFDSQVSNYRSDSNVLLETQISVKKNRKEFQNVPPTTVRGSKLGLFVGFCVGSFDGALVG